jgi:glutamate dehydrogenase/leucine dehydrogenase
LGDGNVRRFEGFRVQHSLTRGPGKSGIRVDPKSQSRKELENLARRCTSEIGIIMKPDIGFPILSRARRT